MCNTTLLLLLWLSSPGFIESVLRLCVWQRMCMEAKRMLKIYISSEITSHAVLECVKKFASVERVDWMEDAKKEKRWIRRMNATTTATATAATTNKQIKEHKMRQMLCLYIYSRHHFTMHFKVIDKFMGHQWC